jgi:hypothetical protein
MNGTMGVVESKRLYPRVRLEDTEATMLKQYSIACCWTSRMSVGTTDASSNASSHELSRLRETAHDETQASDRDFEMQFIESCEPDFDRDEDHASIAHWGLLFLISVFTSGNIRGWRRTLPARKSSMTSLYCVT